MWEWRQEDQTDSYISRRIWVWIELHYRSQFIKLGIRNRVLHLSKVFYQIKSKEPLKETSHPKGKEIERVEVGCKNSFLII